MKKAYIASFASNPYVVGTFACLGGSLSGLDLSSMSGVLQNPYYNRIFGVNGQGPIVASMPAGSFFGALCVSELADRIGRKNTVILSGIIWVIGAIIQCAAIDKAMLIAGRVIAGFSIGIATTIVPIYQAEVTAPLLRGRMVAIQEWAICWGILIQYFVQFGCSYIAGVASFRLPWGLQMIPGIALAIGMTVFPESPRWLLDHRREDEALEVLADLHGKGDTKNELVLLEFNEIKTQVDFDRTEAAKSYMDLVKPGMPRRVFLGTALQMWSQLTGTNVMMYYVVYVFRGAGLTGTRVNLIASAVQYVLLVAFTVPAILYIDRWGRRPMLLAGTLLMGIFLYLVGGLQAGYGHWADIDGTGIPVWFIPPDHRDVTIGVIVCSYFFVASFAITMGPVSWTYPAEIYPLKVRGKAVSISTACLWLFNFALAYAVPPGLETIAWKVYFIFGTFNFAAFIHIFFMYPETVGRSLEEIEDVFNQGHVFTAWKIKRDVGKKTLADVIQQDRDVTAKNSTSVESKV